MRTVRGVLELPPGERPTDLVRVSLRIEDISRVDAASIVLASVDFEATLPLEGDAPMPFELPVDSEQLEDGHTYVIRGHVDVSGSGQVEPGDYLTTQLHPVLTQGAGDEVRLGLQRI
jgi:putative lipoprotein